MVCEFSLFCENAVTLDSNCFKFRKAYSDI